MDDFRFQVVVTQRNGEYFLSRCLASIAAQTDPNVDVCVVDDASTDGSLPVIDKFAAREAWKVISNETQVGAMHNQWKAIQFLDPTDEDVIVWVDGDDRLASPDSLAILRREYDDDTLMTYGNYRPDPPSDTCPPALPYPPEVVAANEVRKHTLEEGVLYNHLRTVKYGIFAHLSEEDFQFDDGTWFPTTPDVAVMIPCMELAGDRVKVLEAELLIYTSDSPDAEWRSRPDDAVRVGEYVLAQNPKEPVV
jgi:glycosyltransferase involved in cell wall biosynthesis